MSNPSPSQGQAKINQKLIVRTAILLFIAAGTIGTFQYFRSVSGDMGGLVKSETSGLVAAIQYHDDGQEAVLIKPDGTVVRSEGWKNGIRDRDLAWSPDGNFLYFVSDREGDAPNIFRWTPSTNKTEARTVGTRGRSHPSFPLDGATDDSNTALITSGGFVLEFNPKDKSTRQVLPPVGNEVVQTQDDSGDAGGSSGQFSGVYGKYGKSFRMARWIKGKTWIAAIMDGNEQQGLSGDVLLIQSLTTNSQGKLPVPAPIAAGDKIDFDVSSDGKLVYAVTNYQWPDLNLVPPQFRKGNKIIRPFRHMICILDPSEGSKTPSTADLHAQATGQESTSAGPIMASQDDKSCFISPKFSPDGKTIVFVVGRHEASGQVTPFVMASVPAKAGAAQEARPLIKGEVYEPSWSPDGRSIVFAQHSQSGKRTLYTIDATGGSARNLSGEAGNFGTPLFSPQIPK